MKRVLFLVLFSSTAWAGGPLFLHKDTVTQQEFENTYQDIQKVANRFDNTKVINLLDFGAKGDCSGDDTTVIQAAIDTGKSVYFPPVGACYKISTALSVQTSGQQLFGEGHGSKIVQTNVTVSSNSSVFVVTNVDSVRFDDLYVIPSTTSGSTFDGYGFKFVTSTACIVEHCEISGHLRGGIFFYGSHHCSALANWIHDGIGASSPAGGFGIDIFVAGGMYNTVRGNHMDHGSGSGVGLGTLAGSGVGYMNVVDGNHIHHEDSYGIIVYHGADEIRRVMITNNVVEEVTGLALYNGTDAVFGTCIYVNGTEEATVSGNIVSTCSVNTLTDLLAPASIGFADSGSGLISHNTIKYNTNWSGISIRNINNVPDDGDTTIVGNNIDHVVRGIEIRDKSHVQIIGGSIRDVSQGIELRTQNGETLNGLDIVGVTISTTAGGIYAQNINNVKIQNVSIINNSSYGINVDTVTNFIAQNNEIIGNGLVGSAGINISTAVSNALIQGNYITANQYGMLIYANARLSNNKVFSNTTNFTGVYAEVRTLTANSATPDVTDGRAFVTANTAGTTYTNFTGGYDGQAITIMVKDGKTTFNFTSGSLNGNNSQDWAASNLSSVRCLYNATDTKWYCQVNQTTSTVSVSTLSISGATAKSFVYTDAGKNLVTTAAPGNGQLLIGSTNNVPVAGNITGSSADQVIVTNGAGTIALSTPQSINTSSNVQFARLGLGKAPSDVIDISMANPSPHIVGTLSAGATSYSVINMGNPQNSMIIGLESGTGASWLTGSTGSSGIITLGSAFPLYLATANVIRQTIGSTGNVGFGNTTPSTKVHISSGVLTLDGTSGGINLLGQTYLRPGSQTITQIRALTPTVGDTYYCSNCATAVICTSTGTNGLAFVNVGARATACN